MIIGILMVSELNETFCRQNICNNNGNCVLNETIVNQSFVVCNCDEDFYGAYCQLTAN